MVTYYLRGYISGDNVRVPEVRFMKVGAFKSLLLNHGLKVGNFADNLNIGLVEGIPQCLRFRHIVVHGGWRKNEWQEEDALVTWYATRKFIKH